MADQPRWRTELRLGTFFCLFLVLPTTANWMALLHLQTTATGYLISASVCVFLVALPLIHCLTKRRVPFRQLLSVPSGIVVALITILFAFVWFQTFFKMLSGEYDDLRSHSRQVQEQVKPDE